MEIPGEDVVSDAQVRLRLSTREQDISLPNTAPILVPTNFRRYQLSTLVNSLLEKEKIIPLEFIVNGTYLRTSLSEYLTENGISTETVLAIEYVRARIPPQYVASFEHDDWVSGVDVSAERSHILTTSYDGRLRIWNASSQVLATSPATVDGGHASFVKSGRFISPSKVVSASFDRTVRIWEYSEQEDGTGRLAPQLELYGHKGSVESVRVHPKSNKILSASADHAVGLWSTRKSDAPAASESLVPRTITREGKRRKLNPSITVPQRGPLMIMQQHTAPVTDAIFDEGDASVGYSVSMDHTVRTWDLTTSASVDTRTVGNALFCIEHMPGLHLLACGSASRDVKLVDPRASATTITAMALKGHKNHVVALARDPGSEYGILSGSHDGTCRIWDVRSAKSGKDGATGQSLFTISRNSLKGNAPPLTGEGVKIFAVGWDRQLGILSAGEDKVVQINNSGSIP